MQVRWMMIGVIALCLVAGCSSSRVVVGPRPPAGYRAGGETVSGKACGFLLFSFINVSGDW